MPLYKIIALTASTQILVWKITESYQELLDAVVLNDNSAKRLSGMKSQLHQRGFLSVRMLLQQANYTDLDLYYDAFGKPHLQDGQHISITHSHEFAALIISNKTVGIDIELQREKIIRIADKFADYEFQYLESDNAQEYIRKLTVIWGVKEAIFKIRNEQGISFKEHIKVQSFNLQQNKTRAELHFDHLIKEFEIYFEEFEITNNELVKQHFTLVYAFEK